MFWVFVIVYWKMMVFNGFCVLGKILIFVLGFIFFYFFIKFEGGERLFKYEGYVFVVVFFFSKVLEFIF